MRTVASKVRICTSRVAASLGVTELEVTVAGIPAALTALLEEQHRDTRHACAESVNILTHTDERGDARIDRDLSDVESVILETKAV